MCTVTIHRTAESLLVTMNRDEVRFRAPEIPPQIMLDAHTRPWMAPLDGQAGGTWFGANEHALQACLLNRYLPGDAQKWGEVGQRPSRGKIIVELLARGPEQEALDWLDKQFDPEAYPSFWLLVIGPGHTHSFAWNGHDTIERGSHDEPWSLFSSSSLRTDEVLAYRKKEFDDWISRGAPLTGLIPSFHLWQPQGRAEWAPLMDREYSATRSITQTWTDFANHSTEMRYWPREQLHSPAIAQTTLHLGHERSKKSV
jgi:Transport and Golgi organisation 2